MKFRKRIGTILAVGVFYLSADPLWARSVVVDDSAADETVITMKIELCPKPKDDPNTEEKEGPTPADLFTFIETHQGRITEIWNACNRRLRIRRGSPLKNIRFVFEFSVVEDCDQEKDPDKKRYQVHLGSPPDESGKNADAENLWLENTSRTFAHELGHGMGLDDEYDYDGGTRENLLGRGSFTTVTPYHVMTILFGNAGDPDAAEDRRRTLMKTLLRMKDQTLAKRVAADNGITGEEYEAYKDQFTANGTQIQPGRPK